MSTSSGTVRVMTEDEQARAQGEQDAAIALAEEDRWRIAGGGMLTVHPVGEWFRARIGGPTLTGPRRSLGYRPLVGG